MLDIELLHTDRAPPIVRSQLSMIVQFLGAVSLATENISCVGSNLYFQKAFNRSASSKVGVR